MRTHIARLYATHAHEIADALGEKTLCVVTGPRRFGKTTSLLPALAAILRARGKTTDILNGRDYERTPFTVDTLRSGTCDVLIIDEANVLTRTVKKTADSLQLLHTRGNAIVSFITFHMGYEPGALHVATIWQDAETSIHGQPAPIVRLPQMIVSPRLASDLLIHYSPIANEDERSQVLTYIVERVPLNPHVLLELAGARSVVDVNRIVRQRKRTLFQGALSPDEYRTLEQSLNE